MVTLKVSRHAARVLLRLLSTTIPLVSGCDDATGAGVELCPGHIGDPSVNTSCVFVEGKVLDPEGSPASAFVNIWCGPEALLCEGGRGQSNANGSYRVVVHALKQSGGRGVVVASAWDNVRDIRAKSDTVAVDFVPKGEVAPVYQIDLQLHRVP